MGPPQPAKGAVIRPPQQSTAFYGPTAVRRNPRDLRRIELGGSEKMGQEDAVKSIADRLPDRFPVGTRYAVEGRTGAGGGLHILSRFVQYPDGRRVLLPPNPPNKKTQCRRRSSRK